MGRSLGLTKQDVIAMLGPLDKYGGQLRNIPANVTTHIQTVFSRVDPSMQAPWPGGWDANPKTPYPAAAGGIFPARPGGTIIRIGEAGRSEAVIPLGRGVQKIQGTLTIADWREGIAQLDGELAWSDSL
jgi:hypothetical protein